VTHAHARLLFDSISLNTGDIAIGIAGQQVLADHGATSIIVDPFTENLSSPLIIGGGELIRTSGDPFYDSYRRRGRHILNAAGIWTNADDLDYLNEYEFVSARSTRELEVLRKSVPSAELLPCSTTLLRSDHYVIPGIEPGETVVGIHMVPHSLRMIEDLIPLINAIPHKKVFIPFTHYNGDASFMKTLPFDKTNSIVLDTLEPLQLHSVISQMSYVLVSSLHASIFAYSQNVPFASVHQKKAQYYFEDRGLGSHLVVDHADLSNMIHRLDTERFDFTASITRDKARINEAFAGYVSKLGLAGGQTEGFERTPELTLESARVRDKILLDQAHHVIGDRDLALAYSEYRRLALIERADKQDEIVDELVKRLVETEDALSGFRNAWWRRYPRGAARRAGRALGRLSIVFKRS
jgi:Polysaccharide pyruvyl transferase